MIGGDSGFLHRRTRPDYSGAGTVRIVDLFSGCGGMTLGAMEAARSLGVGSEVALAMESDAAVRAVYESNFDPVIRHRVENVRQRFNRAAGTVARSEAERATQREVGSVHLLLGGPPCQGHSNLNNHTRRHDEKNILYMRMVRAAEVLAPEMIVIENVPAVRRDSGRVLDCAIRSLEDLGYDVDEGTVAVVEIGVPQLRVRHVLIASSLERPSVAEAVAAQRVARPRSLKWALRDMKPDAANAIFGTPSRLSPENETRARFLIEHDEYDLPNELRPPCHRDHAHRYKSMYGRLRWTEPAQTITTGFGSPGQGRYLHPDEPRTITPQEAARLQFFPDWFDFSAAKSRAALAKCIGNAVPPKLAFALARHLLRAKLQAEPDQSEPISGEPEVLAFSAAE